MMLRYVLPFLISCCLVKPAIGQSAKTLYYFVTNDEKLGVKDAAGKIIIPANFMEFGQKSGDTVSGEVIYLYSAEPQPCNTGYCSAVAAYNRKGEFIATPFLYDNGPDYISEGLFRIVKDNKIGFADRDGKIVIEPKYGFALPFQHGLSFYCRDCYFYRDSLRPNDEHNLRLTADKWGILDKAGNVLSPSTITKKEKIEDADLADFVAPGFTDEQPEITDSLLATLPAQFSYAPEEQKILTRLTTSTYLGSMVSANLPRTANTRMNYEIVERPSASFPFYWIKGFQVNKGIYTDAEENFLVSNNGLDFYRYEPMTNSRQKLLPWKERFQRR